MPRKPTRQAYLNAQAQIDEAFILYHGLCQIPEFLDDPQLKGLVINIDGQAMLLKVRRRQRIAKRSLQLARRGTTTILTEFGSRTDPPLSSQPEETQRLLKERIGLTNDRAEQLRSLRKSADELIEDLERMIESFQNTIDNIKSQLP